MSVHPTTLPSTINEYLAALRHALTGADPALIQDALSDAETHLREERAARAHESEATVLQAVVGSYGSPADVAAAYLDTDRTVQAALSLPTHAVAASTAGATGPLRRFFAVYSDVRSWTGLLLMVLSLFTGLMYFSVTLIGLLLSIGLSLLIIGLPVFIGFIGLTRILALVEGRVVEAMTGERMPRRARPVTTGGWLDRIRAMLSDRRTWSTLAYQLLSLPLGILRFMLAMIMAILGAGLVAAGAWEVLRVFGVTLPQASVQLGNGPITLPPFQSLMLAVALGIAGVALLTALMHLARLNGRLHGRIAKTMLVES